jgi:ethanolamine ammonia-lyase small subunit
MNKDELKAMVADLLRELQDTPTAPVKESAVPETFESSECLPDITELDLRKQYLVPSPVNGAQFLQLKSKTPARIGVGRAGARYRTITQLRMRADHAAAQDSVFSDVPEEFWRENDLTPVQTMCRDKEEYLTRPDLGRRFDESQQIVIRKTCGEAPRVLLVIGDGLSSAAIEANAMDCAAAIRQGLTGYQIPLGKTLFVKYCRVGASDAIGEITQAEMVCMLVGERPGLVTAESMSAYLTYQPRPGISESKRTVVSNIHAQGTPSVEAGAHIAELIHTILTRKASGVDLREAAQ